jgi:hypothetical protein
METDMDLSIHQDKILTTMADIKSNERSRASEAGDDREEIGNLLELTGLNKKALSFVRSIDKMEPDKREDVLRSLHPLLDLMDKSWNGQNTADMFETASTQAGESQADPDDDETDDEVDGDETDPELAADDAEFESHLAEVSEAAE